MKSMSLEVFMRCPHAISAHLDPKSSSKTMVVGCHGSVDEVREGPVPLDGSAAQSKCDFERVLLRI